MVRSMILTLVLSGCSVVFAQAPGKLPVVEFDQAALENKTARMEALLAKGKKAKAAEFEAKLSAIEEEQKLAKQGRLLNNRKLDYAERVELATGPRYQFGSVKAKKATVEKLVADTAALQKKIDDIMADKTLPRIYLSEALKPGLVGVLERPMDAVVSRGSNVLGTVSEYSNRVAHINAARAAAAEMGADASVLKEEGGDLLVKSHGVVFWVKNVSAEPVKRGDEIFLGQVFEVTDEQRYLDIQATQRVFVLEALGTPPRAR